MRTDIHRPSVIIPSDYEWVAWEVVKGYFQDDVEALHIMQEERARITAHMARTGGHYSMHEHGGNCGVCGSVNAIYTVLFYHRPSNTYVRMGQDCAEKCAVVYNNGDFDAFKNRCKGALALVAGKRKAEALLSEKGVDSIAWDMYTSPEKFTECYESSTIRDIVISIVKYGHISERQVSFLKILLDKYVRRDAILAERAVEKAKALEIPITGERIEIVGEIIKIAVSDGPFGGLKMTVKSVDGWVAWGSVPRTDVDLQRGNKIKFVASITRSDRDSKFGFFKRPNKLSLV